MNDGIVYPSGFDFIFSSSGFVPPGQPNAPRDSEAGGALLGDVFVKEIQLQRAVIFLLVAAHRQKIRAAHGVLALDDIREGNIGIAQDIAEYHERRRTAMAGVTMKMKPRAFGQGLIKV